jgi:hypothetical protein
MFSVLDASDEWRIEELEATSTMIREFQPAYILARLRTAEYQAHLYETGPRANSSPVRLTGRRNKMMMTESALRWRCAPPSVLYAQMRHMLAAMDEFETELSIIPMDAPVSASIGHAFHIYEQYAVVVGILGAKFISRTPATIEAYSNSFDALHSCALVDAQARAAISRIANSYREQE